MVTGCIDLGNTLRKAAIFTDGELTAEFSFSDDLMGSAHKFLDTFHPDKVIMASVTDHAPALEDLLASRCRFHKLTHLSKLSFKLEVDKPETVGPDRIALAAAAADSNPDQNNLIIALGSCITFNFINKYHSFLGGAISPGMQMRFASLHRHTARLPLLGFDDLEKDAPVPFMGYDTRSNIKSGVINGMVGEMEWQINAYKSRYEGLKIFLTGGNSGYFAGQLKNRIFADPYLLFKGLNVLSKINNE